MSVHLFLGGVRSGKSLCAEQYAIRCYQARQASDTRSLLHYVATAQAFDPEMQSRIDLHQARRDQRWHNHECPLQLAALLGTFSSHDVVLIDCLSVWVNNLIYHQGDDVRSESLMALISQLVDGLEQTECTVICVASEVGLGVVPMGQVSRLFVDHCGRLNQAVASVARHVVFVTAGLEMVIKDASG